MHHHPCASICASLALCVPMLRADMLKDSPVKFPDKGALPSKYPPDVKTPRESPEKDYSIFGTPERSLAQLAKIRAEMVKGTFTPPPTDWQWLPRTRQTLTEGGDLHILAFGDSIVADTMRSAWLAKLGEAYPKAKIIGTVYVRGGGGCQHYKDEQRIQKNILPRKPDLVFIGGISQRDVGAIRECIHQLRAGLPKLEILLASGAFGSNADPRLPAELAKAPHSGSAPYGAELKQLAAGEHCAYLDMTTPWAEYLNSAKVHPHIFYRDRVHANECGEQILSQILLEFFRPSAP